MNGDEDLVRVTVDFGGFYESCLLTGEAIRDPALAGAVLRCLLHSLEKRIKDSE